MVFSSGNKGETVRSDCFIELSPRKGAETVIRLKSKVEALFGDDIKKICEKVLQFYGVESIQLDIEDSGALPFVIAARLEAALRKLLDSPKEFLMPVIEQNCYYTKRNRRRQTRLYLPGNNPKLMINAGIYGADGIILDLEDSVHPDKKQEARLLVRNALCQVDFYGAERMVRINPLPQGLEDLKYVVPFHVNVILIPKCENAETILSVEDEIQKIVRVIDHKIHLMPIIETALGVENAFAIASASPNVVAIAIGLEDYTADLGVVRSPEGNESLYARTRIVNAAVAAGIQPIDSVFSEFEDRELLFEVAQKSKALGFQGMGCIHPAQVDVIKKAFIPSDEEIEQAVKIAMAFYQAQNEGKSVVAVGSKMVDPPVVKRSLRIVDEAIEAGKLRKSWREEYGK